MTSTPKPLPLVTWRAVGVGGALLGLLPWLITGAALPAQNLGVVPDLPVVLLPISQYFLTSIVGLLVIGAAPAGLAARILRHRRPRFGGVVLVAGVLAVQAPSADPSRSIS